MLLWHDVRFGVRTLWKDRTSLAMAVLALALGIGATTAIFSVIDNVLLEPFPYTDAQRLVAIQIHDSTSSEPYGREVFQQPEFADLQEQSQAFDASIGVRQDHVLWTGGGAPESWNGASTTGNTFQFLGVPPLVGRAAAPADARPDSPPVFVMSFKLWQKRFSGDPSIVGKTFTLDSQPRTLIGIMPKRFAWWGADIWIPTSVNRAETDPSAPFFFFLGHLKPGLTLATATPDLRVVVQHLSKVYPKNYPKKFDVRLITLADNVVGRFRETLFTALGAVGLLLLIACANVANLLLAKGTGREREFAIRSSLGAGRAQVVRQLLVESVLLALSGAAFGCLFAWLGLKALIAALPMYTFPDEAVINLNLRVLAATIVVAVCTALLFGLMPALGAFTGNLSESLKAGGRGSSGSRRGRLRNTLIVFEVALSLVLLTGAGLLMRGFLREVQADLGLETEHLVVSDISLGKNYKTADQQSRFVRELSTRLRALPEVDSASGALDFPPFGGINTDFEVAGRTHSEKWKGEMGFVDAQFFRTVGIRLLRGRFLSEDDIANKRKVVVINEAMAKKFFPGEDPIGKQVELLRLPQAPIPVANPWFEIVGVSSNVKNHGVKDEVEPETYAPVTITGFGEYLIYVRAIGNPAPLVKQLEGAVLSMDKNVHPRDTATLAVALDKYEYAQPRFTLQIFAVFAAVGLILVTVGVYSVVSYTVTQQHREIGIRMALGASAASVRKLVITGGMRFIAAGVGVGLLAAIALLQLAKNQIWGVSTYDPLTLLTVVAVLAAVGLAACYLPSRRATRVDPLVSLRYE
ncbi:MAG: ABC transporter permease [Acidobacteriaceae bacterium]|nr:ABC transporter permease [Acidobacteriaceae bacterium]